MAAAAWALVAVATGVPSVDAMFSSSSDVVQASDTRETLQCYHQEGCLRTEIDTGTNDSCRN